MPASHRDTLLCRYHYDPLDRLVNSTPIEQPTQRYYCKSRLATEIQGAVQRSILQHDDQLLAQQQLENHKITTALLATDPQRSVLNALDANQPNPVAYLPYGHHPRENGLLSVLGFNGERPDPVTGHYHLGNGYRQFNPVLMRFNSPDSWSPFGKGGLNRYAYCAGDPINNRDPSGHALVKPFLKSMKKTKNASLHTHTKRVFRLEKADIGKKIIKSEAAAQNTTPERYLLDRIISSRYQETEKLINAHNTFQPPFHDYKNARPAQQRLIDNNILFDDILRGAGGHLSQSQIHQLSEIRQSLSTRTPGTGAISTAHRTISDLPPAYDTFAPPSYREALQSSTDARVSSLRRSS